jgi:hypothetical protein
MYKVDLYIDGQRADLFEDENIEINLSVQNIKDISKVFGDFTNSFSIPASKVNNKIFKHYYNVDIDGGYISNLRTNAFIEVNGNLFRAGVLELEGVQIKKGEPSSYNVGFYSNVTSLKDKFGEDQLNDLNLSALDHTYNDTNIEAGLDGYVSGTDSSIIYPLISPVRNWYYNSASSDHEPNNISYHNGHPEHGVFYYDLKPAVKLKKIVDAIETKYGIEFQSNFFDSADFGKLFMWCHRRAGYMFKDQTFGGDVQKIDFTSQTGTDFNLTTDEYEINSIDQIVGKVRYTINSTNSYKIEFYINDELFTYRYHSGNVTNVEIFFPDFEVGDKVQMRFAPPKDWDGNTITLTSVSTSWYENPSGSFVINTTTTTSASQAYSRTLVVASQMPEQKISDFIGSLVRAFNLVIVPVANNKYDIEPLDDWYAEGSTREVTEYIDTEEVTIGKPSLYRRISFSYNETEAVLGEQFRLQNDIGYGDLRADFAFDGEEFEVEVGFDHMLFERLDDLNNGITTINVGKSITREIEPYIGSPLIFYLAGQIRGTDQFAYIDMGDAENAKTDFHLVSNVNNSPAENVTKTLNFGTEVDPYLLQGFSTGLYNTYWKDYITDLYDRKRRVFQYSGQLPLGLMLALKVNDKLTIGERNYIINQMKLNLTTGEAQLELLNDV